MDNGDDFVARHMQAFEGGLSPSLSKETVRVKTGHVKRFLEHASSMGVASLVDIDPDFVYGYVGSLDYARQTKSLLQFCLRELFDALFEAGLSSLAGRDVFPYIRTDKRDRILSFYTTEEVRDIVGRVDLSSPNGVRDKCMVLLAAQMGLRSGDILGLRLHEIKWDRDSIEKVQSKTGLPLSVPMPENVKLLLADYIMSHRPESDSDYVFVNAASGGRYCDSLLYGILRRLIGKSNVDPGGRKRGPHALRHSLATSLLSDGVPLPVISGILGHSSTQTTRAYLGVDVESLRRMSLEVPGHGI